ncbi:MAG: SBBP repeat-containing protein, partial [Thermoflexales bacterium]|nr:SBBP repeat-containing protein [Thermoflexales bacterium]
MVFFTSDGMVLSLPPAAVEAERAASDQAAALTLAPIVVRARFEGANPAPEITGIHRLPGSINYFIGSDPGHWRTDLPTYAGIVYRELYPGIDLHYDGEQGALKGTYVVAPGADPSSICLAFEGVDRVELDARGDLVLYVSNGEIRQASPYVYQEFEGEQRAVPTQYVLSGERQVRFQVAAYDVTLPLIIDPHIEYATFLGGDYEDAVSGIAVDASGNVYVAGNTYSSDFPTQNPLPPPGGRRDAFVTKLSADGQSLMYSTYLGGDWGEYGVGIAIDGSGNAYVAGYTSSTDFPTASPTQSSLGGRVDAFITQLNPSGSALLFSTFLGGTDDEFAQAIAVGGVGDVYVTGYTSSSDFPTVNPQQPAFQGGGNDAFVARLNSSTPSVLYATYLGGAAEDRAHGIACDASGNAYVVGETRSSDFPVTVGAFQAAGGGSWFDAFVTTFNSTGSAHRYSTYLGGSEDDDRAHAVAVDALGNAFVTGHTESTYFPTTPGAYNTTYNGSVLDSNDAFIAKIEPDGSGLVFSTYLGGSGDDWGQAITLDRYGNVYVAGDTWSTDLPVKDAFQGTHGGGTGDGFVAQLDPPGSNLVYASYLGGSDYDWPKAIAVDGQRSVYVAGVTQSSDFPMAKPFDASYGDYGDGFVVKLGASSLASTGAIPSSG